MKERIVSELAEIARENKVEIVYACESGSRAWGFPSADSDYDVRFIYVHPPDWYISIAEKRDVIELPLRDVLDLGGWDIRKALTLLRKSNSPFLEWLSSPIVYAKKTEAAERLSKLAEKAFLPETSCHHYLSMAKNSFKKLNHGATAEIKTYMYTLRPLLCCEWIIKHMSQPPMMICELMDELRVEGDLSGAVKKLIDVKKHGKERAVIKRSHLIENYCQITIDEIPKNIPKNADKVPVEIFDDVLREIIGR